MKYDPEIKLCLYYGKIVAHLLKKYKYSILITNCDGCVKSSKKATLVYLKECLSMHRNLAFQIKQYFKNNFQDTNEIIIIIPVL